MTRNALTTELRHMLGGREPEMYTREAVLLARMAFVVAAAARPRVVSVRVATSAGRSLRDVERPLVRDPRDALMARHARDARELMRSTLEGVSRVARTDPEHSAVVRSEPGHGLDIEPRPQTIFATQHEETDG
jgi:hypothetical protein